MDEAVNSDRFSRLLRDIRIRSGLTQQELADLSALSVRALRDLESGRVHRPRRDTVRLLTSALRLEGTLRSAFEDAATAPGPLPAPPPGDPLASPPAFPPLAGAILGRDDEIRALIDLLCSGGQRLISITGLRGVGKSRLSAEVADRLRVLGGWRVLWASGSANAPDTPPPVTEPGADRDTLLVLDDCRPGQYPKHHGVPIGELLRADTRLRVLVTATAPLRVPTERVMPLGPLPTPAPSAGDDPAALQEQYAVRLFLSHVRRVRPGHRLRPDEVATVAALCRQLDGLPAAIEHAADWCLIHPVGQLLTWARENPLEVAASPAGDPADRDVRGAVQDAISGLAPDHSVLLRTLAAGGRHWSFDGIVAHTGGRAAEVARGIHALLLRGLVHTAPGERRDGFAVPRLVSHAMHTRTLAAVG